MTFNAFKKALANGLLYLEIHRKEISIETIFHCRLHRKALATQLTTESTLNVNDRPSEKSRRFVKAFYDITIVLMFGRKRITILGKTTVFSLVI